MGQLKNGMAHSHGVSIKDFDTITVCIFLRFFTDEMEDDVIGALIGDDHRLVSLMACFGFTKNGSFCAQTSSFQNRQKHEVI